MTDAKRQMHLGVFAVGAGNHVAGWRYPGAGTTSEDYAIMEQIAQTAERAKFDFFFLADGVHCVLNNHPGFIARFEPLTLLSALAVKTSRIGLVATASTSYTEPYNLARLFASVDRLSNGRAGWNVVTSSNEAATANFGREELMSHDLRYEMATEFVDVVQGLWDTWEADAYIIDKESGRFLNPSKVHTLDHKGKFYSVKGPLNASRTPQGQPVIVQAGASADGQKFAAHFAEVVFTVQHDRAEAAAFYKSLKAQTASFGRSPEHVKILPGLFPVVGHTDEEARAKLNDLMKYVDSTNAMRTMSDRFGHDMSQYPLDAPVPDIPQTDGARSFAQVLLAKARREGQMLRDVYNVMAVARGYIVASGSAKTVADTLEEWFTSRAADGFVLTPAYFPGAFDDFVELVVPELQRRGLFRTEYKGHTLREHMGLPQPENRFTAQRRKTS